MEKRRPVASPFYPLVTTQRWLHGVFVGDWLFVFPLCGFSLSLFCNYYYATQPSQHRFDL